MMVWGLCEDVFLLAALTMYPSRTQSHFFFSPSADPLKRELFLSDKPHSLLWAALCLSSNLDSLFATPDKCGGTFLQSQPFAGMGQTFLKWSNAIERRR